MSETMIKVITAVDGCGKNCPDMEIDVHGYRIKDSRGNRYVIGNSPKCRYTERCKSAIEQAKLFQTKEARGGEEEC